MREDLQGQLGGGASQARRRWDSLRRAYAGREAVVLALVAILLLGASMRLTGVDWDQQTHLHPDERFLTDVTSRLAMPKSLGEYFDEANSPLNPYNCDVGMFVYGTAPVFLVKAVGWVLDQLKAPDLYALLTPGETASAYSYYWRIHLVGRVISACYDLAVVLLVFLIGRRLYSRWVGLLGALLMSCTVLNIQHAHFYVVEPYITLMVTLAMYFAVRTVQEGRWYDWALLGVSFGLAVAGKISMLFFGIVIAGVCLLRALREVALRRPVSGGQAIDPLPAGWRQALAGLLGWLLPHNEERTDGRAWAAFGKGLLHAAGGGALVLLAALLAFRIAQPYAFEGPGFFGLRLSQRWLNDMAIASRTVSGAIDMPPSHQWTDRAPILFSLRNMVLWGMGLPLGLAAWLGWLVAVVELLRRRKLEHLLLLLWVTLIFVHQSTQFVKVVRYFLPIYPMLVLLGAYFLTWLWRQGRVLSQRLAAQQDWRGKLRLLPAGAAGLVVAVVALGTFLYAEAYTNIYRRPLSRVTASRWVYDNIPQGATITYEEWDDIVPQNIDGKDAGQYYNLLKTSPYWEDVPEKREALFQWLDQADYIIFSSNRLYDSIPRLPERYPLTTAYYRYLFSGELGFEVIKVITSYPNLGPIQFVDDTADEAFTVYDHPKVTVLKKTEAYSPALARRLLGDIPIERLLRMSPVQTMKSHHGLMLTAAEREAQEQGGTWSEMFDPQSIANRLPVLAWLLATEALALAALPFACIAFPRFRDRGFIFAKALGLLLVSYLAWLAASLHVAPYTRLTILACSVLLLAAGALLAWRRWREITAFVRQSWPVLLREEVLYLGFFLALLLVRMANPDLWYSPTGGEKPMDLAYLQAVIKSTWFPPYDPWFAGGYINYYYFGQVIVATVCKLTAIVPTTAYNLAVPTLFALTAMGAYAVVGGLLAPVVEQGERKRASGVEGVCLFAALLVAVLGNLAQVRLLLNGLRQVSGIEFKSTIPGLADAVKALAGLFRVVSGDKHLDFRTEWWYWNATRVMGDGEINEFPYFTFLFADLHAHLIALPFALLALGLTVSLLQRRGGETAVPSHSKDHPSPYPLPWKGEGIGGSLLGSGRGDGGEARLPSPSGRGDGGEARLPSPSGRGDGGEGSALPATLPGRVAMSAGAPPPVSKPALAARKQEPWGRRLAGVDWAEWLSLALLALTLGELRVNNTWDYPTYLLVALGGLLLAHVLRPEGVAWERFWPAIGRFVALVLASTLLFQPFHSRYGAAYTSVELWHGPRTQAGDYLVIHGLFLFILVTYALSRALGYQARGALARTVRLSLGQPLRLLRFSRLSGTLAQPTLAYQIGWLGIVAMLAVSMLAVLMRWWLVGLVLPLTLLGAGLILRRDLPAGERFAALLFVGGLLLTLLVEVFVLRGDVGRMNTVFKFYLQVWVLWSIAASVGLAVLLRRLSRWAGWRRNLWLFGLDVLVFCAALYPLTATGARVGDRFDKSIGLTLDGTAYAQSAVYMDDGQPLWLGADMEAIRWLQQNVQGSPVILEGVRPFYRWSARVSIYTGLPTVLGWDWHQKQQRAVVSGEVVDWRVDDISHIYNTTDDSELVRLLDYYRIAYVYVGELERAFYNAEGLAKFDRLSGYLFDVVYEQGPVTIYKVRQG